MRPETDAKLRRVAALHQAAARTGVSSTAAIVEAFDVSATAAKNLVARARREGLIPPAEKQFVHRPVQAVINPRGAGRREWQVCQECLVSWPCPEWRTSALI